MLLSGVTVAIGLAVLVALPVPFMRSMGIGGMLVPLSAVLCAVTILPAVLCALGPRVQLIARVPAPLDAAGRRVLGADLARGHRLGHPASPPSS